MFNKLTLTLALAMMATIGLRSQGSKPACSVAAGNAVCFDGGCSHCGCRLAPICHVYCDKKKVTEYKYCCKYDEICIPGVTPLCKRGECSQCAGTCVGEKANGACAENCGGRCVVRPTRQLTKFPVSKEVPVKKCKVEWVCPKCNYCCPRPDGAAPAPAPTSAPKPAPVPPSAPLPPAPGVDKSAARWLLGGY